MNRTIQAGRRRPARRPSHPIGAVPCVIPPRSSGSRSGVGFKATWVLPHFRWRAVVECASRQHLNESRTTSRSLVLLPLELLGAPEASCLVSACLDVDYLTVHLAVTAPTAACRVCGSDTRRVHSRYTRRLDDLTCLGRCVRLRIAVRCFVCHLFEGPRRIFAERLPGFAAPRARATDRLRQTQAAIGSSLGGGAVARLAAHMAMTTSSPVGSALFGEGGLLGEPSTSPVIRPAILNPARHNRTSRSPQLARPDPRLGQDSRPA
jgi:hypothetical protein